MASLEAAIYARLANYSGVSNIVGTRVYPVVLPQDAKLPAVTYQRISGPRVHAMGADTGNAHPRIQVDSWDDDHVGATALATQVRAALSRYSGATGGVTVDDVFVLNDIDLYDSDGPAFRVSTDFEVWHRE